MNPVKAKIVKERSLYRWSSYNLYINKEDKHNNIIEREEMFSLFSQNKKEAIRLFIEYTNEENKDTFIDIITEDEKKLKEERVRRLILEFIKSKNRDIEITDINNEKILRNKLILELKEKTDLSIRQIAEILGINRNVVQRIK